jgi:CHAT domain-containing protein
LLIGPNATLLATAQDLILIPDDDLNHLPFDALRASSADEYLGLTHAITLSPSLAALRVLNGRPAPRGDRRSRLVALVSSASGPNLPSLPGARDEATAVAQLYPASAILDAAAVSKADVAQVFTDAGIVHVAMHALTTSPRLPPHLVLNTSARASEASILSADEIETLAVGAQLVVLAGCSTARGPLSESEGSLSLAVSFLRAGVSTVVASLWDIDDDVTRTLMLRFYQLLQQGKDPTQAMLEAKRTLAADTSPLLSTPRAWAGFVVVGAGTRHSLHYSQYP